jgi:FkbM family methyltransferase
MKNVLLDLGTHYGQGLREFIGRFGVDKTWKVYTFEANPVTFEKFLKEYAHETPYVEACNIAVSDHFGTITVNLETPPNEDDTGMGSSVVPLDVWDPWGNNSSGTHFHQQREVSCFDFSRFILENFSKDDNIIVKMDIEGSEYDVLEKMIVDGSIEYLNHISVEWHSRFFKNKDEIEKREAQVIDKLKTYDGLVLESWR